MLVAGKLTCIGAKVAVFCDLGVVDKALTANPPQQHRFLLGGGVKPEAIPTLHLFLYYPWFEWAEQVVDTRNNAVFDLRYHLVLVTKYRRKALTARMRERLQEILAATLVKWRCQLMEFGGESDHVHLLFSAHPALDISHLVNNLKTVSSRLLRSEFGPALRQHYWKPVLWHGAYYVGTVGHASLETVKRYVERQGQDLWPPKRRAAQNQGR